MPIEDGWLHLAVMFRVGSRRVDDYSIAADMAVLLLVEALDIAAASRSCRTVVALFHSDRGPNASAANSPRRCAAADEPIRRPGWQLLGQQRGRVVLLVPEARIRHTDLVRDPRPSTPGHIRLDRPLQHPQNPLCLRLPHPYRMGGQPPATTKPSPTNQVSDRQREVHYNLTSLHCSNRYSFPDILSNW